MLVEPHEGFLLHEANGSMLRGVLGHALARWDARRGDTLLPDLFGATDDTGPRPYRIVSHYPQDLAYGPPGSLSIEYDLFGRAILREGAVAEAWRIACGELGFGNGRVRAEVIGVERTRVGTLAEAPEASHRTALLEFVTPTSLKLAGAASDPNLPDLLAAIARRASLVLGRPFEPPADSGLVAEPLFDEHVAHRRLSMRSGSTQLRGLRGVWRVHGRPNASESLLFEAMERFGVGRGAVFGMGQITYRPCLETPQ
ncbi:MAG: CRISPR system precrRNA processing endoribonuclease RAMP protein Cas6 [Fimbriimonadaceae bacterium]|nr:CRISPR system precrRNA processing endoribonuclease RAMP protein Cas6 [Fimbriimonadaceae bacterium]